jgi:hypothetical protein
MPGKEARAVIGEQRNHRFILAVSALENTLAFERFQVKAVQERELAFLLRAVAR